MRQSRLTNEYRRDSLSLQCWVLCGIFLLIVGFVPALPGSITQLLRPIFIMVCFLFSGKYYKLRSEKWQFVLLVYWVLILLLNPITNNAFRSYISLTLFGLFFAFAASRVWTKKEIRIIIDTVIVANLILSMVLIITNDGIISHNDDMHISFFSFTCNRNTVAFGCVPGVLCAVIGFFYGKRRIVYKLFCLAAAGLGLFSVFALACRSAFLSLAIGCFLIVWQTTREKDGYRKRFALRIAFLIFILLTTAVAYSLAQGTSSERLFDLKDDSGRSKIWDKAWELIDEKPILGGGFDYWGASSGEELGIHNTFLSIMVMSGYTGGVLFVIFLIATFLDLLKARNLIPIAFFAELAMHSYTESGLDYYAYIPLILAFILARFIEYQSRDLRTIFA